MTRDELFTAKYIDGLDVARSLLESEGEDWREANKWTPDNLYAWLREWGGTGFEWSGSSWQPVASMPKPN